MSSYVRYVFSKIQIVCVVYSYSIRIHYDSNILSLLWNYWVQILNTELLIDRMFTQSALHTIAQNSNLVYS